MTGTKDQHRWFLLVAFLGLIVRLVFIFNVSTIQPIWDANGYWVEGMNIRHTVCAGTRLCPPGEGKSITASQLLNALVLTRSGVLPPLIAGITLIFPAEPRSIYVLFALLDALVCWMTARIARNLGLPLWVSLAAGLLFALYVPAAIGTGAVLQQPLIRFGIVLAVWAYTYAFTLDRKRSIYVWAGIGTLASVLIGMSSITTRPFLVIIPVAVVLVAWKRYPVLARAQAIILGIPGGIALVGIVLIAAGSLILRPAATVNLVQTQIDKFVASGGPTTIYSYPRFWPADSLEGASGSSFPPDTSLNPGQLVTWWISSIFMNWRFPDYIYFQEFILSLEAQKVLHVSYVMAGLLGLMWLIGQPGIRQNVTLLISAVIVVFTLFYGIISVETRRMVVLSPFLALGSAVFLMTMASIITAFLRQPRPKYTLFALVLAGIFWLLTPAMILLVLPVSPLLVQLGLMVGRFVLTLYCGFAFISYWRRETSEYHPIPAIIVWVVSLIVVIVGLQRESDWREWSVPLQQGMVARQTITGFAMDEALSPWLLLDVEPTTGAFEVAVNGQVIKTINDPLYLWEAGTPPLWPPYRNLQRTANFEPTRLMWHAIPVPRSLISDNMTIDVTVKEGSFRLRGDFADTSTTYTGPLFDPWYSGRSLWRWQWNGYDPRIPWEQSLNGSYVSSVSASAEWDTSDLSEDIGIQKGIIRVFLVLAAFGPDTNALVGGAPNKVSKNGQPPRCDKNTLVDEADGHSYVCRAADNSVSFYDALGNQLGSAPAAAFQPTESRTPQIRSVYQTKSQFGNVEVLQVLKSMYVVNFYTSTNILTYSLALSTEEIDSEVLPQD